MEGLRWPNGPVCPHCGNTKAYFLTPKSGSRATGQGGKRSIRRVWKCAKCRRQFSVLTKTIFHGSKIPLQKWVMVMFAMVSSKNGISAREVERTYDVDTKTAWFMLHRIREAMKRQPAALFSAEPMKGTIAADETFIGGANKNRHAAKRDRSIPKAAVLTLVNKETGEARSKVVPNVRGHNLKWAMQQELHSSSILHTDEAASYGTFSWMFAGHETVNHAAGEYSRLSGKVTTNQAENFFSQLKRSLDGTHHHVSAEHLPRYLAEFDFRYTTRTLDDSARMRRLMGQTGGRRLSYRPLTDGA